MLRELFRGLAGALVAALTVCAPPAVAQSTYPDRPIRLIVPYATGGSTTNVARLIGQKLTDAWGQPVLIDNRPGANTMIGTELVAKAAPDGYTLLLGVSSHVLIPLLVPSPYDAIKDFAPVASVGSTETILVVYPGLPASTLKELIDLAKSKPGSVKYATGGAGSATHLASELFNNVAGVDTRHIPYKGAAPAMVDLAGGHVEMSFAIPGSAMALIKSGKLRALAVTGDKRLDALPEVPTFAQAGLPGFEMKQWYGVLAPANTPRDIVDKLSTALARIASADEFKQSLSQLGMDSFIITGEQLGRQMRSESQLYSKIIKDAGIKVDP
ncbi:MAG: Bug family tripartite tricarboxylate transporter substrate binding protein [Lautropia sp.]